MMTYFLRPDLKELVDEMVSKRYVSVSEHPKAALRIYNYTAKAQYEKVWNEATLMCRGLILGRDNEVIARPFPKFFNLGEHEGPLPDGKPDIFDKADGSLGILYWIGDTPYLATRGSFVSDQARVGTEMLHEMQSAWGWFDRDLTYLFEIVYPENRIVVDYKDARSLILLDVLDKRGEHCAYKDCPFDQVLKYEFDEGVNLHWLPTRENAEGYVLRWRNGFRLKVKFDEYVRLHKILTECTSRKVWELLKNRESMDQFLEKVPDEFYVWFTEKVSQLKTEYMMIEEKAKVAREKVTHLPRKEAALFLNTHYKPVVSIVFAMMDGKDYSDKIWRMIKPGPETPFNPNGEC